MLHLLCGAAWSQEVRLPNQEYVESHVDLSVATLAGDVQMRRTWVSGRWYVNPAWADLRLHPDPMGGVLAVERSGSIYQRTGSNAAGSQAGRIYQFDPDNFIAQQKDGWRWYDRLGNSIAYDAQGRALGYADPHGNSVRFMRTADGLLSAVQDHHGRTIFRFAYDSQKRLIQATDVAGNSVTYQWSGSQLAQVTDAMGQPWRYQYDSQGQITGRTNPLGQSTQIVYASKGRNIPATPGFAGIGAGGQAGTPLGGASTPSNGSTRVPAPTPPRVAGYRDESGANWNYRLEYDRSRLQYTIHIQRPDASQAIRVYDKDGWLLHHSIDGQTQYSRVRESATQEKSTNARGLQTIVQRNAAHQVTKTIYPDGSVETTDYDNQGRAVRHVNPLGVITQWKYDAKGALLETVQAAGRPEQRTWRYERDARGYLLGETYGAGDARGADALTERYTYDDWGRNTSWTNAQGETWRYAYNSRGQLIRRTDPLGRAWQYSFDAAGRLIQSTDPLGRSTRHQRNALGLTAVTTLPSGKQWSYAYDAARRTTQITNPLGHKLQLGYDAAGRSNRVTGPSGLVLAQARYDGLGRLIREQDAAGNAIEYEYAGKDSPLAGLLAATQYPTYRETHQYDQRGRPTVSTEHLGGGQNRIWRQAWDAAGRLISASDAAGNTSLLHYDALGRLIQTTDPLARETRRTWDAQGRLQRLTDARGHVHRFEYDKAGRLIKETRPGGGSVQYRYDAAGQLIQRIDAGGNSRHYTYDAAGQLTLQEHKYADGALDERIRYHYDSDGDLSSYEQTDGSGQLISRAQYSLDALGRRTRTQLTYAKADGSTFTHTLGQDYNADGQLQSHTYPDGSQQSYSYAQGRLAAVTLPDQSQIGYGSYQWMVPGQIDTPGSRIRLSVDALQRLSQLEVRSSDGQTLASSAYQYDQAGNITQIKSDQGQTDYGYDKLDRLIRATPDQRLQALGLPVEQYSYDAAGNRTSSAHQPGAWRYNRDNQLTQYPRTINPNIPGSQTEPTDVSYTAQGHTESESSPSWQRNYRYNAAERLVEITQGNTAAVSSAASLTVSYRYDPFGRRIAKTVTEGQSSQTTYYLNGDSALLAEANEAGQITKAYGFNPATQDAEDELWSTDPVWQADIHNGSLTSSQTRYHYITTDHLGTPILATDKSGNKTWRGYSQAFGHTDLEADNSTQINLRFPGQYFDRETGLHQNYFRDYSPARGRYIQSDPLGIFGGLNTYEYASSDPLGYIDPTGEAPVAPIIWGYVRCVASCTAQTAAIEGLTGDISCFDPTGTAKDCALSCANPVNWFKGRIFVKGGNKGVKPQNPNKRPPPPHRQQSGDRERNVKHPDAEEHSRRPKGGFRRR